MQRCEVGSLGSISMVPLRWHILEERGRLSASQLAVLQEALRSPADEPSALSPHLVPH